MKQLIMDMFEMRSWWDDDSQRQRYDAWLHVDAAYAGSTFIESKYREVALVSSPSFLVSLQ
ncbi:hypothetical protein TELCIR_24238 [Teladorsagia circumcincta]|uniref:Uncharacterized protein n=1 Tax=Teladorsagia circumcincta TaxID=45464 RepID=A0A2G9TAJ4_TELCI|nr:hypothetical protein TELCIR_24238 [Teladorsagia circumcincta]